MNLHPKKLFPETENFDLLNHQLVTKKDLLNFVNLLFDEIKVHKNEDKPSKWLKSSQVRKLLNISPGTLQNLRINGELSYTKVGGILFYSIEDIEHLLESNKVSSN